MALYYISFIALLAYALVRGNMHVQGIVMRYIVIVLLSHLEICRETKTFSLILRPTQYMARTYLVNGVSKCG